VAVDEPAPAVPVVARAPRPISPPAVPIGGALDPTVRDVLMRFGIPAAFLMPVAPVADARDALVEVLADLPVGRLPTSGGSVLLIVGERRHAMAQAASVCADLGVAESEVVVATPRRAAAGATPSLTRPEHAADERRSWRWRRRPTVVVLEVRPDVAHDRWAARMVEALEPTFCLGVVEAYRKPEDIAMWSKQLGGLDGLALIDATTTSTPAAILGLDLPVSYIDGALADTAAWLRLLEPWLEPQP
jgi:hypothetical protein